MLHFAGQSHKPGYAPSVGGQWVASGCWCNTDHAPASTASRENGMRITDYGHPPRPAPSAAPFLTSCHPGGPSRAQPTAPRPWQNIELMYDVSRGQPFFFGQQALGLSHSHRMGTCFGSRRRRRERQRQDITKVTTHPTHLGPSFLAILGIQAHGSYNAEGSPFQKEPPPED